MNNDHEWFVRYVHFLLKKHLRQVKKDFDTKSLLPPSLSSLDDYFYQRVSDLARETKSGFRCIFCEKVFSTRKGIYMHLIKKHLIDIEEFSINLLREVERMIKKTDMLGS